MILGVHAIIGGAIGSALETNPETTLLLGWFSHYFFDFVPHWDYCLRSAQIDINNPLNNDLSRGRDFYYDLVKLGLDAFLGLVFAVLFFVNLMRPENLVSVLAGAVGALLPDFLQFIYIRLRSEPFTSLQKIHNWAHSSHRQLNKKPLLGFLLQLLVIFLAFFVGNWRFFCLFY
ncbi:MAG: hypothetical protein WCX70_00340 [Candidatus Paceibacterota bacterium]